MEAMDSKAAEYAGRASPMRTVVEQLPDGTIQWAKSLQDFPGCIVQASTGPEAHRRLREIIPQYSEPLRNRGVAVPPR